MGGGGDCGGGEGRGEAEGETEGGCKLTRGDRMELGVLGFGGWPSLGIFSFNLELPIKNKDLPPLNHSELALHLGILNGQACRPKENNWSQRMPNQVVVAVPLDRRCSLVRHNYDLHRTAHDHDGIPFRTPVFAVHVSVLPTCMPLGHQTQRMQNFRHRRWRNTRLETVL